MKYKTLFRLALKLIGVAVCVFSIGMVPEGIRAWAQVSHGRTPFGYAYNRFDAIVFWTEAIIPVISFCTGLYLFFGGEWIVNRAIPSNRSYCHECGYLLKDLKCTRCPECDTPFKPDPSATA